MFAPLFLLCSDRLLLAPTNFVVDIHEEDDDEDDSEDDDEYDGEELEDDISKNFKKLTSIMIKILCLFLKSYSRDK